MKPMHFIAIIGGMSLPGARGRLPCVGTRATCILSGVESTWRTSYRVAVIGRTGKGNYGHGLDVVWKSLDNVEIVAVADEDEKGRAAAAQRLGRQERLCRLSADAGQGTAADRQRGRSLPRLATATWWWPAPRPGPASSWKSRWRRTLAEADEMVTACETHHVKLAIAHQTRYSPRLQRVKELIAEGRLGDLLEMHGRGKEDSRGGGQDMMVLGTHILDLMRFLAGDARWCFAQVLAERQAGDEGRRAGGRRGHGPDRRRPHQCHLRLRPAACRRPSAPTRPAMASATASA